MNVAVGGGGLRLAVVMRFVDVRAGQWRPIPLDASPNGLPLFWDTDETFIAPTAAKLEGLHRCDASGSCVPVVLPADLPDPQLVPRRGERPLR